MNMEDEIYDRIVELCEEGDELVEEDCYPEAIIRYEAALELVPNPKYIWEASTWIYTALGDVFSTKSVSRSIKPVSRSVKMSRCNRKSFHSIEDWSMFFWIRGYHEGKRISIESIYVRRNWSFWRWRGKIFYMYSTNDLGGKINVRFKR